MTKAAFQYYLKNPTIDWTCNLCALPNVSDSFFLESSLDEANVSKESLSTDNSSSECNVMTQFHLNQVRINNPKRCIIANLNINSLPNKFEEVKEWLNGDAIDILSLQETKIDRTFPNSHFHVNGFKLFRRDRVKGGGGIAVFVRDHITAVRKRTTYIHTYIHTYNFISVR